jgi:hypothetical protein
MMAAGAKMTKPTRSNFRARTLKREPSTLRRRSGIGVKRMRTAAMAPMGRLM